MTETNRRAGRHPIFARFYARMSPAMDAGGRPEFPVSVRIEREDGAVTGEMSVVWTLRPNS